MLKPKVNKNSMHSHDVARDDNSIEIDVFLCIELYENFKLSMLLAISLLQIHLSLLENDPPGYLM